MTCLPFGHASVVFSQGDIAAVMQAIFDAPVRTGLVEQLEGSNFISCQARKTILDLFLDLTGFV